MGKKGSRKKSVVPKRSDRVLARKNADGSIGVLNFDFSECYFLLHGMAADVWSTIDGKHSTRQIEAKMSEKYREKIKDVSSAINPIMEYFQKEGLLAGPTRSGTLPKTKRRKKSLSNPKQPNLGKIQKIKMSELPVYSAQCISSGGSGGCGGTSCCTTNFYSCTTGKSCVTGRCSSTNKSPHTFGHLPCP